MCVLKYMNIAQGYSQCFSAFWVCNIENLGTGPTSYMNTGHFFFHLFIRCLDPGEEIDLINVAFEQRLSQDSETKYKH